MAAQVQADYRHFEKAARFAGLAEIQGRAIKLYEIASPESFQSEMDAVRAWVDESLAPLTEPGDCGFLIHHHCGPHFRFLLLGIWRGNNELWEAVWYRDEDVSTFQPFDPAYPPPGALRPTFCVWELGVVGHEAQAWSRYLHSARDEAAREAWQGDGWSGDVR